MSQIIIIIKFFINNIRARAIKRCENVAEKIDLLIDWVRYAFPPHHELDIFDVVMNVHLHLMTLSFEKITEPMQEEIDVFINAKVKDSDHLIPKSFKYDESQPLERHETDRIRFVRFVVKKIENYKNSLLLYILIKLSLIKIYTKTKTGQVYNKLNQNFV